MGSGKVWKIYYPWLLHSAVAVSIGALAFVSWAGGDGFFHWISLLMAAIGLCALFFVWRGLTVPARVTERGFELIKAQDFNNRLARVHEPTADSMVDLFNRMIDRLREERLHNLEQDNILSLLVEASPMGVLQLDFDGKITFANDSFFRLVGSEGRGAFSQKMREGRGSFSQKMRDMRPQDIDNPLVKRMLHIPLGSNEVIRMGDVRSYRCWHLEFVQTGFPKRFFLIEDMSREMMQAEKNAYEKVIRVISHEVNNTMGGVQSVLETIHDAVDDADIREVVESCGERCANMGRFISAYADVVRLPDPVLEEVDLETEIEAQLPFLRQLAGDIPLSIERHIFSENVCREGHIFNENVFGEGRIFSENACKVKIDPTMFRQTLVNIVKNSIESIRELSATSAVGLDGKPFSISISLYEKEGSAVLEIADNGKGISDEVSSQLFSPFFTTKRDGKGIGLTLVKEILTRHSIRFSLRTDPDSLTRFRLHFPTDVLISDVDGAIALEEGDQYQTPQRNAVELWG